jgi:hypothetical protein
MKAHIEGAPSFIRMASKERIAMHPAPGIAICSGDESKRLVQCVLLFKALRDNELPLLITLKLLLIGVFLLLTTMDEIHLFLGVVDSH